MHPRVLKEVRYAYDESNTVLIDRLAEMGRKDRRTKDGASPLVLVIVLTGLSFTRSRPSLNGASTSHLSGMLARS
jgi:hypothetical protein